MKRFDLELVVGLFVLAGVVSLGYVAMRLGRMELLGGNHYRLEATFTNSGGLKPGSTVSIAGVDVGRVKRVELRDYEARVEMDVENGVVLQEDAIASIRTRGLIGEKFIELTPGGSDVELKAGDRIRETEPAVDIGALISKYVFSDEKGEE